jgi:hypothetical protein
MMFSLYVIYRGHGSGNGPNMNGSGSSAELCGGGSQKHGPVQDSTHTTRVQTSASWSLNKTHKHHGTTSA